MNTSEQIRKAFLDFWSESPRNSKIIPNSSLVPMNVQGGNTLLFVNSGMFPIIPFLTGQPHPLGTRVHNVQRCIRTKDIEDVGDNRHLVMFEMIGNWSLGDFTKKEQIPWCLELYVEKFGLDPKRLYITVWNGDAVVPRDLEAIELWKQAFKKYGVDAEFSENIEDIPADLSAGETHKARIFPYGRDANWWEVSHSAGEPGGPSSEIFYDLGVKERDQDKYHINDDSGRFVEIGNNVFMEYKLDENLKYNPLEKKNIDFGGGFDRIIMAAQNTYDVYSTDLFTNTISKTEELTGKKYKSGIEIDEDTKAFRVIAEHIRSSVFILADGIKPSSKDQGYILRRLIRRMIRYGLKLNIQNNFSKELAEVVINKMSGSYPHLLENKDSILDEVEKEENAFRQTLVRGLKEIEIIKNIIQNYSKIKDDLTKKSIEIENSNDSAEEKVANRLISEIELQHNLSDEISAKFNLEFSASTFKSLEQRQNYINALREKGRNVNGDIAFYLYETYGFPLEMTLEELKINESESKLIEFEFKSKEKEHKDASRAGAEQKFKGGLADHSQETTKLHTAHHLLLAALQKIVDPNIKQRGSNITQERLRIDFNLDRKLTPEETKQVEDLVNEKINEKLNVVKIEMNKSEAEKLGAQMEFGKKYEDRVNVYMIGDVSEDEIKNSKFEIRNSKLFSMEFCGGPHVSNTSELGEGNKKFKILKEESSGAGIRRIKAALV